MRRGGYLRVQGVPKNGYPVLFLW